VKKRFISAAVNKYASGIWFFTAVIYMIAPVVFQYNNKMIPTWYLIVAFSSVTVIVMISLILATRVQAWKHHRSLSDISIIEKDIRANFDKLNTAAGRDRHFIEYLQPIQEDLSKANDRLVLLTSPDMRKRLSDAHEYIIVYIKSLDKFDESIGLMPLSEADMLKYKNPDNDPRGPWASTDFTAQGYRPNQIYKITTPGGAEYRPPDGNCWKM
jgi:hypothetical protein